MRRAILTGADLGDSLVADVLIQGDEKAVFGDKAYDRDDRRAALAGMDDGLMHRRHPRRRSPSWHKWTDIALTPIRCQVERIFGTLKRSDASMALRWAA